MLDGAWEVSATLSEGFEGEREESVEDERERAFVRALRDACEASLGMGKGGMDVVRGMDVWVPSFV